VPPFNFYLRAFFSDSPSNAVKMSKNYPASKIYLFVLGGVYELGESCSDDTALRPAIGAL
jgi:hypothetical protein